MREGIHPNYYQAKVVCNCGNELRNRIYKGRYPRRNLLKMSFILHRTAESYSGSWSVLISSIVKYGVK